MSAILFAAYPGFMVLLLFMMALIIKALHGGTEKISVESLTKGDFSGVFIIGAMSIGLVFPLIILMAGILMPLHFSQYALLYYLAMIMEIIGIYSAKYSILRAGAYSPIR